MQHPLLTKRKFRALNQNDLEIDIKKKINPVNLFVDLSRVDLASQ